MKVKCDNFCRIGQDNACNFLSACHSVIGETSSLKLSAFIVMNQAFISCTSPFVEPNRKKELRLMKPLCLAGFLLAVLFISGCQGTGEIVKLRIQHIESEVDAQSSPLTVAVSPFDDQRQSSEHLGMRTRGGGSQTYFDVMGGTLSQRVTNSFVDFLNQAGFSAKPANGAGSADVRISSAIHKFTVQAEDKPLSTFLEVDSVMAFTVQNAADDSTVRIAVGAGGTDHEILFAKKDLEDLIGKVLGEGFEEFLEKTEVQGKAIKFRLPEESS